MSFEQEFGIFQKRAIEDISALQKKVEKLESNARIVKELENRLESNEKDFKGLSLLYTGHQKWLGKVQLFIDGTREKSTPTKRVSFIDWLISKK